MPAFANLAVSLTARTQKFNKGMNRAKKKLRTFGSSVAAMSKKLAKFGTVAAGVAAGALSLLVRNSFKAIDSTTKLGSELGIATEELTAFQHGAQLTGGSAEGLNKGLRRFVRSLGDVKLGLSEPIRAFELLGISAQDLAGKTTSEALRLFADGIANVKDPSLRAAAAAGVMGRQGQVLINFLKNGSEGLDDFIKEAKRLGISFDELSGAKIEAANDAILRVKQVFAGLGNTLAIEIAPIVKAIADKFTESALAGEGMGARVKKAFGNILIFIGKTLDVLALFQAGWDSLKVGASLAILGITGSLELLIKGLVKVADILGLDVGKSTLKFFENMNRALKDTIKSFADDAGEHLKDFTEGRNAKAMQDWLDDINKKADEAAKKIGADRTTAIPATSSTSVKDSVAEKSSARGMFKALDRKRFVVGGIGNVASDPTVKEIKKSNEILEQIKINTSRPIMPLLFVS